MYDAANDSLERRGLVAASQRGLASSCSRWASIWVALLALGQPAAAHWIGRLGVVSLTAGYIPFALFSDRPLAGFGATADLLSAGIGRSVGRDWGMAVGTKAIEVGILGGSILPIYFYVTRGVEREPGVRGPVYSAYCGMGLNPFTGIGYYRGGLRAEWFYGALNPACEMVIAGVAAPSIAICGSIGIGSWTRLCARQAEMDGP